MQKPNAYEGSRREFLEVLAEFDAPAYIRRAKRTHDAYVEFMTRCEQHRQPLLEFAHMRLGRLAELIAHDWPTLSSLLVAADVDALEAQYHEWQPTLRVPVASSRSKRRVTTAVHDLIRAYERFNSKWRRYVDDLDFSTINDVRAAYNNYYVCEKAAALQSEKLAAHGFKALPPLQPADVLAQFPFLPIPSIRAGSSPKKRANT